MTTEKTNPVDDVLSLAEAAHLCGLAAHTLTQQAHKGRLQARKVGRTWVTTRGWLGQYLAAHAKRGGWADSVLIQSAGQDVHGEYAADDVDHPHEYGRIDDMANDAPEPKYAELAAENAQLRQRIAELEQRVAKLETALTAALDRLHEMLGRALTGI